METQNHLMHPRVAHNHRDNGYFPTDQATLSRIAACLDIPASAGGLLRIFDPCCGTGEALASLASTLQSEKISCQTYGIELEKDRAQEAMSRLTSVIKSDVENCTMQGSAVGLLFLNPPYGFAAKDNLSNQRTKRLEELFFARTFGTLQPGGVLVMIVPEAALTEHLTGEIATHCTDVRMIRAAADTYKQLVIFGIRPKNKASISKKQADAQQRLLLDFENAPETLPAGMPAYCVPIAPNKVFRPRSFKLEQDILERELGQQQSRTLWSSFSQYFGTSAVIAEKRRPLCALGQWHAALALAAGQVNGVVTSTSGRKLLVKGSTHKTKVETKSEEYGKKDRLVVTITSTDRFSPSIRAIDLTEGSSDFGRVLTIK